MPERARYDVEAVRAVLDAGLVAHVGFVIEAQPFVIPMLYARDGDEVLLHGSVASRLMKTLAEGLPCCLSVTHVDGLVLARSHFNHSMNYRSAVLFGRATLIEGPGEKRAALARLVNVLIPRRAELTREADAQELAATKILRFVVEDASVKSRSGPPEDHPDDLALPVWAGVVPLAMHAGPPEPAEDLHPDADADDPTPPHPAYVLRARADT